MAAPSTEGHFQIAPQHLMRETQYVAIQRNDNRVEHQAGCQNGNQHTAQGVPELLAKLRNDVAVDDKNTLKKTG